MKQILAGIGIGLLMIGALEVNKVLLALGFGLLVGLLAKD